jgi:hypothetical protein
MPLQVSFGAASVAGLQRRNDQAATHQNFLSAECSLKTRLQTDQIFLVRVDP